MQELSPAALALLIADALNQPVPADQLHDLLLQLAAEPEAQARAFAQVQRWLAGHHDPAWIEMAAAAQDGIILPEMAQWRAVRQAVAEVAPALVLPFDLLEREAAAEPLLLTYPNFFDQWQQTSQPSAPVWVRAVGFEWQQWQETGRLLFRRLQDALSPATPLLMPVAVKGDSALTPVTTEIVQRMSLNQEQVADLDLEAVIRRTVAAPHLYSLVVSVQIPSRWPDLAGVLVTVSTEIWSMTGLTDMDGEVIFQGIPEEKLEQLVIEINCGKSP